MCAEFSSGNLQRSVETGRKRPRKLGVRRHSSQVACPVGWTLSPHTKAAAGKVPVFTGVHSEGLKQVSLQVGSRGPLELPTKPQRWLSLLSSPSLRKKAVRNGHLHFAEWKMRTRTQAVRDHLVFCQSSDPTAPGGQCMSCFVVVVVCICFCFFNRAGKRRPQMSPPCVTPAGGRRDSIHSCCRDLP